MTEGELKEQINYARKMHNSVKLQRKWQINATLNGIEASVDEAIQDYQSIFHAEYNDNTTIPEINRQLNYKQQEWFKKWFDDVQFISKEVEK